MVEKIKLRDLLFEEYLKIECNVRNAIQNRWQVSQLEDIWGIELTKLGNLVYKNHKAQTGLQNIALK
ncbi:pretranslocase SecA subunit-like domain protein [Orientia tsutsugamushi str. UT76]|nr:pretranslocase SecA subunit-like domain protein [Orientia tsutsugamushi str. UT76]